MITTLLTKVTAEQKLRSTAKLVDQVLSGDWPHEDPKNALEAIKTKLDSSLSTLLALDDGTDPDIVRRYCQESHDIIADTIAFVGFILRSSNIRNPFEIYAPLRELGAKLLGKSVRLVTSSEWNYTPFVYPIPRDFLADFVFVGLPASESENALLVPIAGHEIGHALWRRTSLQRSYKRKIHTRTIDRIRMDWSQHKRFFPVGQKEDDIDTNFDALSVISSITKLIQRQSEELFCDLVGLTLFGTSFAYAFHYLIGPDIKARISGYYPSNRTRARHLVTMAPKIGVEVPNQFVDLFRSADDARDHKLQLADAIADSLVPDLFGDARRLIKQRRIRLPTSSGARVARNALRSLIPVSRAASIADIINAAWEIWLDIENWDVPGVDTDRKPAVLNDLVFKSFEVIEWSVARPRTPTK